MAIKHIPLTDIVDNPFQPRTDFDQEALRSLADEIKAEGFWSGSLQGRRTTNGKIELVFGHRRLRALKLNKAETVPIEIVDLTDAQMALRSLEENLQREGLTDLEKADAVRRAIDIAKAERVKAGKPEQGAIVEVSKRLGLADSWVSKLDGISRGMPRKLRERVEAGHLTAQTAFDAQQWGGTDYALVLADQGKLAKEDTSVPKPTHMTVKAMRKVVSEAPEPVRENLKKAIVQGDVTTPKEAEQKARRLAADRTKRNKKTPEDLSTVIVGWTHRLKDWTKELKEVVPYMEYIDEIPAIASPFYDALEAFIESAQLLLKDEPIGPRPVGRGQTRKRLKG